MSEKPKVSTRQFVNQNELRKQASQLYQDSRDPSELNQVNSVIAELSTRYIMEYEPEVSKRFEIVGVNDKIYITCPVFDNNVKEYIYFRYDLREKVSDIDDGFDGMETVREFINDKIEDVVTDVVSMYFAFHEDY